MRHAHRPGAGRSRGRSDRAARGRRGAQGPARSCGSARWRTGHRPRVVASDSCATLERATHQGVGAAANDEAEPRVIDGGKLDLGVLTGKKRRDELRIDHLAQAKSTPLAQRLWQRPRPATHRRRWAGPGNGLRNSGAPHRSARGARRGRCRLKRSSASPEHDRGHAGDVGGPVSRDEAKHDPGKYDLNGRQAAARCCSMCSDSVLRFVKIVRLSGLSDFSWKP